MTPGPPNDARGRLGSVERLDRHVAELDRVAVAGEAEVARGPILARVG